MIYPAKTTFTGFKIGLGNPNLYVAVPKKYFKTSEGVVVQHQGELKRIYKENIEKEITLPDKIKPGTDYILSYALWEEK